MKNIDKLKARRILAAGDDALELLRSMQARHAEARADAYVALTRLFYRQPELERVPLDELLNWDDDALFQAAVRRDVIYNAIEARDYAADLRQRLEETRAAGAPAIRLASRTREYLSLQGVRV